MKKSDPEPIQLTERELRAMLAVRLLGEGAYGPTIRDELKRRTDRAPSFGALYTVLERLEKRGLFTTRMADPNPVRGGRRRKYYRLNALGAGTLSANLAELDSLRDGALDHGIAGGVPT